MLVVETIAKIRRYYFVEGKKIREISREMNISRNTVRKVIRSEATEHRYERNRQPLPVLGSMCPSWKNFLSRTGNDPGNAD
jgi:orotate phosphoribosyltransferase-like protein